MAEGPLRHLSRHLRHPIRARQVLFFLVNITNAARDTRHHNSHGMSSRTVRLLPLIPLTID